MKMVRSVAIAVKQIMKVLTATSTSAQLIHVKMVENVRLKTDELNVTAKTPIIPVTYAQSTNAYILLKYVQLVSNVKLYQEKQNV